MGGAVKAHHAVASTSDGEAEEDEGGESATDEVEGDVRTDREVEPREEPEEGGGWGGSEPASPADGAGEGLEQRWGDRSSG